MRNKNMLHFGNTNTNLLKCSVSLFLFLLSGFGSHAKDYYFSSSSGNDAYSSTQAQNPATPWKSISKLNSFFNRLVAGDNIYFKRGDTFYGCIVVTKSGKSGSLITIGAYGTGNKPVISGLTTLTSWSAAGGGVYQASAPSVLNTVNLVTLNDSVQQVGRYPNATDANHGFLTYESFSGINAVTDNQLKNSPNWTGAELVIRKQHYATERCRITSHSGNVLKFERTASINPLNNSEPAMETPTAGFGYFFQRDPRTLDQLGEWYFDISTSKMMMYFGNNRPSSYSVKASSQENLINISHRNYININNIVFEGANKVGIYTVNSSNITVQNCDMNSMGGKAILFFNCPDILIDGVSVNNALCGAIDLTARHQANATVRNCNIKNTGMIAGMGSFWDDNDYKAISIQVTSDALIENNTVENTGYVPIQFQGSNVMVRNNFINYFDIIKDDGGGIYSHQGGTDAAPGKSYTNRTIRNNIILNGIGAPDGTNSGIDVDGIFLDGRSENVDILDNSIASVGSNGIYTNNSKNVNIRGNTCFNNGSAIGITKYSWGSIINLSVKQNIFYSKYQQQKNFNYVNTGVNLPVSTTLEAAMQKIGKVDSNYYSPSSAGFAYRYRMIVSSPWIYATPLTFAEWKSFTNHDMASKLPAKVPANVENDLRFEYNATNQPKTINLQAKYIGVDSTVYNGSITLQPYTSKILVYDGAVTAPITRMTATANTPPINCFGGSTTVSVTGTGGTAPFAGTGSYSVNAGMGSLKISAKIPVPGSSTYIYSRIGAVSSAKNYILRFSTLGTTANGSMKVCLRRSGVPYSPITPVQSRAFGTSRIDHEFFFTAPETNTNASFLIQVLQSSGTVYIDNIAFFEAAPDKALISNNLYAAGQFENNIRGITTWSLYNNHSATWDVTSKISNTYYFPVKDAKGAIATATAATTQPGSALLAKSTAGTVTVTGGRTTVVVSATGGTAPYTGTGNFTNVKVGTYNYTVSDANGCTSFTTVTVNNSTSARMAGILHVDTSIAIVSLAAGPSVNTAGTDSIASRITGNIPMAETKKQLRINAYPNPSSDEFGLLVEGGTREIVNITVQGIDGRVLYQTKGNTNNKYVFGNNLVPGMYIVKVMQGNSSRVLRIVKGKLNFEP